MMNVLALGLLFTSLVTAGFFSPSPETRNPKDDVIVKEGHRVVVVEFEKDDGNTKVSISPQDSQPAHQVDDEISDAVDNAKEKVKEASSTFSPRELVCDAYGKCKHKITSAIGKTKEKAHEVEEDVNGAVGKIKDTVTRAAHKASDKAHETKGTVKDAASDVSSRAKDIVAEKGGEIKEGATAKVYDVIDSTKRLKEEAKSQAGRKMEGAEEMVEEVKEGASKVKKQGQKELSEIARHAREVVSDAFAYVVSPERVASATGILHLMGFSAAYGMCLWITFASSYVLAGALPRHQFAMVQSKIYPVYFNAMAYAVGVALLGHLMGSKRLSLFSHGTFQGLNLLASLGMILANLLYLEPRATKVLFERLKKEKEEGRGKESHTTNTDIGVGPVDSLGEVAGRTSATTVAAKSEIFRLSDILRRLNSYSSFLNILTLMSLTGHLVHLGQHVHIAC